MHRKSVRRREGNLLLCCQRGGGRRFECRRPEILRASRAQQFGSNAQAASRLSHCPGKQCFDSGSLPATVLCRKDADRGREIQLANQHASEAIRESSAGASVGSRKRQNRNQHRLGRGRCGAPQPEFWNIRAARISDDHRVARPVGIVVGMQFSAQPASLNADNRVNPRVVRRRPVEYLDTKHVFL